MVSVVIIKVSFLGTNHKKLITSASLWPFTLPVYFEGHDVKYIGNMVYVSRISTIVFVLILCKKGNNETLLSSVMWLSW